MVAGVAGKGWRGVPGPAEGAARREIVQLQGLAPVQIFQRLGHAFPGQRMQVHGLGMLEKFGNVGGGDSVGSQVSFETPQPERRKHQQPGYAGDQQP